MPRRPAAVALAVVAATAASCGGSGHGARSQGEVVRALRSAQLGPRQVTLTLEVRGGSASPVPIDTMIGTSGALAAGATKTYDVDHGRAIVAVYRTEDDAARYAVIQSARVVRVRNVVAIAVRNTLSPRLRAALKRLR
ncbi:MAG TPA: hypothetical protein VNB46_03055 [Gaiellaceae bacterium]|nr:hypothetical protein [Gaiellaceae bacterium]